MKNELAKALGGLVLVALALFSCSKETVLTPNHDEAAETASLATFSGQRTLLDGPCGPRIWLENWELTRCPTSSTHCCLYVRTVDDVVVAYFEDEVSGGPEDVAEYFTTGPYADWLSMIDSVGWEEQADSVRSGRYSVAVNVTDNDRMYFFGPSSNPYSITARGSWAMQLPADSIIAP